MSSGDNTLHTNTQKTRGQIQYCAQTAIMEINPFLGTNVRRPRWFARKSDYVRRNFENRKIKRFPQSGSFVHNAHSTGFWARVQTTPKPRLFFTNTLAVLIFKLAISSPHRMFALQSAPLHAAKR